MTKVVFINDNVSPYNSWITPTPEEYGMHFSSIKSTEVDTVESLREQKNKLIQLLESTHSIHEQKDTELLQLKESVSDLTLDLTDERIESEQLREKLFSGSESEKLKEKETVAKSLKAADKLEQLNEQLIIRLQKSEKKHAVTREKLTLLKKEMLKQIKALKLEAGHKEKKVEVPAKSAQVSQSAWNAVKNLLPEKSGIYQLTDGIQQCVGYFNVDQQKFGKTTYFSKPTHWMTRPELPSV